MTSAHGSVVNAHNHIHAPRIAAGDTALSFPQAGASVCPSWRPDSRAGHTSTHRAVGAFGPIGVDLVSLFPGRYPPCLTLPGKGVTVLYCRFLRSRLGHLPSTDNPLSLFGLWLATPLGAGPCCPRAASCPHHPGPSGVSGGFKCHRASLSRQASFGSCRRDGPFSQIQECSATNWMRQYGLSS